MFESVRADDVVARIRNAAIVPLAAFVFAQIYFSSARLLTRVPAALFWFVAATVLAGAVAGAVLMIRAVRGEKLRGRTLAWLAGAVVVELICLRFFLEMVFPWM